MSESERRELLKRIAALQANFAKLVQANERLVGVTENLQRQLDAALAEISRLMAALAKAKGESLDAPSVPSGQMPVYKKPPPAKRSKRPGRKNGHEAANRPAVTEPTAIVEETTQCCPHCDGRVRKMTTKDGRPRKRIRYIEDIEPGDVSVTEHRIHQYWCARCQSRVEPPVVQAMVGDRLGLRLVVTTAVQHYLMGISLSKIVEMLKSEHGITVSRGGLTRSWRRLGLMMLAEYDRILERVRGAGVLHKDETGWRVNGKTHWLWGFGTKTDVYYLIRPSRGGNVVLEVLGDYFAGVSIRDFYAAYNACMMEKTQYCVAHVLREVKEILAKYQDQMTTEIERFSNGVTSLFKRAIRFAADPNHDPPARERAKKRFIRELYKVTDGKFFNADAERLANRLSQNASCLFTFVDHPGVDPTNNWGEVLLRPAVIMRKSSFGNRSDAGAQTQSILMSCFRTMKLQRIEPIDGTIAVVQAEIRAQHRAKFERDGSDR